MDVVRLYDPHRRPPNWTDIIQPGQFVAFAKDLDSGAACDAAGKPFPSSGEITCVIFDGIEEAGAFCRAAVQRVPALRFDVFDAAGRAKPPLLTVVHPSRVATLDGGNPRWTAFNKWGAVALVAVTPALFWLDWWKYDGLLILPTILAINFLIIAARMLQLNAAHASAERSRRERLADHAQRPRA
jgi:hypothetical protein